MILWSVMIILLLFITINQGMYSALTDEYTFKKYVVYCENNLFTSVF